MYERTHAEYIEKLPNSKHSTKGMGSTYPSEKDVKLIDGIEVPLGKPTTLTSMNTALLYNEYIVYDVAQVNMKYLLRVNFRFIY